MAETDVEIHPVLNYTDAEAAMRFLGEAFGFAEHQLHRDEDGALQYVELELGGAIVGFAGQRETDNPFDLGPTCVYVVVGDPDALHQRASAAGAEIVMAPTDQDYGSRDFAARDPEGNVWCFGTYRPGAG